LPKPVLMKPRARKNASAINHGISLEKAENAALNGNKPVVMLTARPIIATAPSGNGLVMMPTIVPTNTANKLHACAVTPAGAGINATTRPANTEYPNGFNLAPFQFAKTSPPARTTGALAPPLVDRAVVVDPRIARFTARAVTMARIASSLDVIATPSPRLASSRVAPPRALFARGAIRVSVPVALTFTVFFVVSARDVARPRACVTADMSTLSLARHRVTTRVARAGRHDRGAQIRLG